MATPGWYGDPTREGRLRYWDGSAWTEHVSEGGGTSTEPILGVPPAPPPAPAPPAAPGVAATGGGGAPSPITPLGRAGFGVAAAGGVLAAAATDSVAAEQEDILTISVGGGAWLGVVAAVLCVGAAVAPWPWARIAGVGVASLFAAIIAFALIGFRTDEDFVEGIDVTLGPAGWMMCAGSLLLFAGTALALVGLRRPVPGPDPAATPGEGKAVASLVLGIVGIPLLVTAAPAVALALYALDDVRASGGRVGGRGLAVAGLVLGIVALSLWALGLTLGMLLAQP